MTSTPLDGSGPCLHQLVEAQVDRTPQAPAIAHGERVLTYAELNAEANRLAHFLRRHGVDADAPVVLFLERSAELVTSVLAVAKAGGAYLPVDPNYPQERVTSMFEQSRARVLLTERELLVRLPSFPGAVFCLDETEEEIRRESAANPVPLGGSESLAYILFTSGSTGKPKGVAMPHAPLVNLIAWQLGSWTSPGPARTLQFASLSFDVASQEIWSTWCAGGLLIGIDELTRRDPDALLQTIDEHGVERLFLPFVALQQLAEASDRLDRVPASLRDVFAAGEALQITPAIRRLFSRLDGCTLHNHYGPTESHVVTALALDGSAESWPELPTIGRPITSVRIYLLDDGGRRVTAGEPGEIFIGGPVLARGYLNQPELTAERFLPDPFAKEAGARMYRTGDLGRDRPDGEIEYLGRADTQVKISGYRVELAEVEAALSRHPGVTAAVAAAHSVRPGETQLVAYVTQSDSPVRTEELRRFVGEHLPSFMVPSRIVRLESFPQTPSGKIDRKALPAPGGERDVTADEIVAPRNELEAKLVGIWEDALGVRPIGVTDDFFDLGATSIVAARLFARIEHDLGTKLPLAAMFQAPTIEQLVRLMQDGQDRSRWTSLVPMQPHGSKPLIFCVHGGAGTILHLQPLVRRLGSDQPFYGLQSRGLHGHVAPLLTVEEMAVHYLSELRTVQPNGPYYLAGYCFGAIVAFDMAQRLRAEGEDIATLIMFNGPSPPWLRTYGGIGGQPSRAGQHPEPPPLRPLGRRIVGVLTSRKKIAHWIHHLSWRAKRRFLHPVFFKVSVLLDRPLPESMRDDFFLHMNAIADRSYEPAYYPGEVVMFHGEGLYDDPEIGWGPFAERVVTYEVPGVHTRGNRESMAEPKVEFVADRLQEYLAAKQEPAPATSVPNREHVTA